MKNYKNLDNQAQKANQQKYPNNFEGKDKHYNFIKNKHRDS